MPFLQVGLPDLRSQPYRTAPYTDNPFLHPVANRKP